MLSSCMGFVRGLVVRVWNMVTHRRQQMTSVATDLGNVGRVGSVRFGICKNMKVAISFRRGRFRFRWHRRIRFY